MTALIACASVLLSASWLACFILALHLREAKVSLIYRNIENTELVQQLKEAVERARKAERVLQAWAERDGKESAVVKKKREVLS